MTLHTAAPVKRRTLSQIGLDMREELLIKSLFSTTPELERHFSFERNASRQADIFLVNGDNEDAVAEWQEIRSTRPDAEALFITNSNKDFSPYRALQRPLNLGNISTVLAALEQRETPEAARAAPATNANTDPRTLWILMVDDSRQAREFLTMKLNELAPYGFSVHIESADNAQDGINRCRNTEYDLIILDVEMPGMNGFDACREIRKLTSARVAMLTGKSLAEDFREGSSAGCNHYLVKPPHDSDLKVIMTLTAMKKKY